MAYASKTKTGAVAGKAGVPQVDESDPRIQRLVEEIQAQVKESEVSAVRVATYLSLVVASVFWAVAFLTFIGQLNLFGFLGIDWVVIGLMAFMAPTGFVRSREDKRIREIEERLPDFLRDVAEGGRFGMTLAKSIVSASKGKYGKLTPEIRRMASQIQWGVSATEALGLMSERVRTPLVQRTCALIIKASTAGGNVADVLELVATDTKEMHLLQRERRASMAAYTSVIYIAFGVFLVTVLILQSTFLAQMERVGVETTTQQAQQQGGGVLAGSGGAATISAAFIPAIREVYFLAAVVHALGDGILAGVIQSGKFSSGMIHAFIMLLAAFAMLRLL